MEVKSGSFLAKVLKTRVTVAVNENTRDRININSYLGRCFGVQVHNAMLIPIVLNKYLGKNTQQAEAPPNHAYD